MIYLILITCFSGSALCQSLITGSRAGSKLATPVMSRVRRPSDVGIRSAGGAGLPSPQVGDGLTYQLYIINLSLQGS